MPRPPRDQHQNQNKKRATAHAVVQREEGQTTPTCSYHLRVKRIDELVLIDHHLAVTRSDDSGDDEVAPELVLDQRLLLPQADAAHVSQQLLLDLAELRLASGGG